MIFTSSNQQMNSKDATPVTRKLMKAVSIDRRDNISKNAKTTATIAYQWQLVSINMLKCAILTDKKVVKIRDSHILWSVGDYFKWPANIANNQKQSNQCLSSSILKEMIISN